MANDGDAENDEVLWRNYHASHDAIDWFAIDIVKRLRAIDIEEELYLSRAMVSEAADEIERLRAKLAEYENVPVRLRHIMKTGTMPPEDME